MKRKSFVLVCLIVLALMAGCATTPTSDQPPTFTEVQYKSLAASQELYNVSWGAFVQLYRAKTLNNDGKLIVDKDRYAVGLKLATTYYDAWMSWMNAVMAYERTKGIDGKLPVESAMAIAQKAAMDLLTIVQPYLMEGQK